MVTNLGSTVTGTCYPGGQEHISLPSRPATGGLRPAHRPWCQDCKRHHDPDQLDDDQQCTKCARAAVSRARAAERRAAEAQARAESATREKAAQRSAQPAPPDTSPTVRAKVSQHTPDVVTIALQGTGITARQTEVAALLADLLAGLNATPATPPRTTAPPRRTAKPKSHTTRSFGIDEQAIIRDYQAGDSAPQIADRYGHAVSTVRRVLDRNNIPRRDDRARNTNQHARYNPSPEVVAEMKRLYLDDELPIGELADRYGHHRRIITRILTDAGVTIRPAAHLRATELDAKDIVDRYTAGTSIVDIARSYRAKTARIREVLTDAGIQIRPKGNSGQIGARLRELGVTARDVKQWAHQRGLIDEIRPGLVAGHLIDAYAAAHNNESGDTA